MHAAPAPPGALPGLGTTCAAAGAKPSSRRRTRAWLTRARWAPLPGATYAAKPSSRRHRPVPGVPATATRALPTPPTHKPRPVSPCRDDPHTQTRIDCTSPYRRRFGRPARCPFRRANTGGAPRPPDSASARRARAAGPPAAPARRPRRRRWPSVRLRPRRARSPWWTASVSERAEDAAAATADTFGRRARPDRRLATTAAGCERGPPRNERAGGLSLSTGTGAHMSADAGAAWRRRTAHQLRSHCRPPSLLAAPRSTPARPPQPCKPSRCGRSLARSATRTSWRWGRTASASGCWCVPAAGPRDVGQGCSPTAAAAAARGAAPRLFHPHLTQYPRSPLSLSCARRCPPHSGCAHRGALVLHVLPVVRRRRALPALRVGVLDLPRRHLHP
jgi:hypothetical protein